MNPRNFGFDQKLAESTENALSSAAANLLMKLFPGAIRVSQALPADERDGVDFWVETAASNRRIAVDCKFRTEDPRVHYVVNGDPADDVALELWSVKEQKITGWTLDKTKRTDYVLWIFIETGRYCIFPFAMLQHAFIKQQSEWVRRYRTAEQRTENAYTSECVFVDVGAIWETFWHESQGFNEEIKRLSSRPVNQPPNHP